MTKTSKTIKFRKCRTVGALIKELEKLPKGAKLDQAYRVIPYNQSESAKVAGLEPCVGIVEEW